MKTRHDLSSLEWRLSGWTPEIWRLYKTTEPGLAQRAEVSAIPAPVPGSIQLALRQAGIIPDWNVGHNARLCEWVENRHWIYEAAIPDAWLIKNMQYRLVCEGLDYSGWIILNGREIAPFCGSHVPHVIDLTAYLNERANILQIVFDTPPRWLGQFGRTSQIKEWKVRFNYMWDWTARLVQQGIWDKVYLDVSDGIEIRDLFCVATVNTADTTGNLDIKGWINGAAASVSIVLEREGQSVRIETLNPAIFNLTGIHWRQLPVELWWPNLQGSQPLYQLKVAVLDKDCHALDQTTRTIGFKHIQWKPCHGAPPLADPWLCSINGRDVFLQGANWVPIRPNFADVTEAQYLRQLTLYRDLGFNLLRVWGGAILEKEMFYRLCDELGIMIWQEFPLSSSGVDDYPPDDPQAIQDMTRIVATYIARRHHHVSLLVWCGGNELITTAGGAYRPVDESHPMIRAQQATVRSLDPSHRFIATSPSGPTVHGNAGTFGHGLHWDVHGPWKPTGDMEEWRQYWLHDDALFRSELGACGASSSELIRKYAGDLDPMPIAVSNPLWKYPIDWWLEIDQFVKDHNRNPRHLEEYVAWSQERQKQALSFAVKACKDRFPKCGGCIIWMGHDCFPCASNTAIIDFEGSLKPAAMAIRDVLQKSADF
ncbi:MAG: glycoside hydrolase family 2 TIM barrel-domain containing protein [Kiritimatiellae bacterium]|nr:glycoside hydrolase family 2 TIM barrel-domain containing protein [Kiritimatiellia bacterium]